MSIQKIAEQLASSGPAPIIEGMWQLPTEEPSYELHIKFDSETGIELHREYRMILSKAPFTPSWDFEEITIDVEAFKSGTGFRIIHPSPAPANILR